MRNIINLSISGFFIVGCIYAQFPCGNGTQTNPNSPVNNQQNEPYFQNDHFLNHFNWYSHTQNTIGGWHYENMGAFYGQQSGDFPSPFSIQGVSPDYDYLLDGGTEADYFAEDGWELLFMNMGQYPDGTNLIQSQLTLTTVPYVILYNKYKGILRVFGKTTTDINNSTYKAVEVRIEFKNPQVSALFGLTQNYVAPMDQPTKITRVAALCNHPNSFQQWFHADFQVAYDPCVCYFRSDLQLHFDFIQSSDITLAGRSIAVETDLYDNGSHSVNYNKEFLANIFKDNNAEANSGSIIYKDIDNMLDDYIAKLEALEAYNSDPSIPKKKLILKLVKGLKSGITAYLTTDALYPLIMQLVPYMVQAVHFITQQPFSLTIDPDKLKKELKSILGQGYDQFTSFLEKKLGVNPPPTPEMPTAIISEMSFSGHVNTTTPTGISLLFNPGTFNNNNVYNTQQFSMNEQISTYNYPAYNEALGTFAVLKTPMADRYLNINADPIETEYDNYGDISSYNQHHVYTLKYKLKQPLKYIINPVLNINNANISAAYVVKANMPTLGDLSAAYPPDAPTFMNGFSVVVNNSFDLYNLSLDQTNPNTLPNKSDATVAQYSSPFVPIDCFSDMVIGFTDDYTIAVGAMESSYLPVLANYYENINYEVYIKLLIEYKFNELDHSGNPNKVTQILTYKVNEFPNSPDLVLNYNLSSYPEDLNVGPVQIPSNVTYQAWNSINVMGNVSENANISADALAGSFITVRPETHIVPNTGGHIRLSIVPILSCNTPMPPVDANFVHSFCNSTDYKAKDIDPAYKMAHIQNPTINQASIDLTLQRSGSTYFLSSTHANDEQITFTITNMAGQILYTSSYLPPNMDLSSYSPGMYLFNLNTENGRAVEKIIITGF